MSALYQHSPKTSTHKYVDHEDKRAALRKSTTTKDHRDRRKIARDVQAAYMAIGRAAGLEPGECHTALAIDSLLYDRESQDTETPRKLPLAAIGAALTSSRDDEDKDARWKKAQRDVSHLFCHAYPRVGLAMQSRFKGVKKGDSHMYASRWMDVAVIVAGLLDDERAAILSSKTIKREEMGAAIGAALERLSREALVLFDKIDTLIIGPDHKPFAVVAQAQAWEFLSINPNFKTATYAYTPPQEPNPDAPISGAAQERIEAHILTGAERRFFDLMEKNTFSEALMFVRGMKRKFGEMCDRWERIAAASKVDTQSTTHDEEELNTVSKFGYDGGGVEPNPQSGGVMTFWDNPAALTTNETSDIDFSDFGPPSAEASAETFPQDGDQAAASLPALEVDADPLGQVNFDSALQAAEFYVRDGWAIVPCCEFDPGTGRCTGPDSHHAGQDGPCKGKRPLIKGKKPTPGAGYTAASRDAGLIRDWFVRQFPAAGVALRLDGHILIDCDVKDGAGGLESYDVLNNTFDLPATLTATTPSGGRHYIFKLPEGLPVDWLGSWTRILDDAELRGIDLKVGNRGLVHVEPSRGVAGVYRWIDPAAEVAELPRRCCDYLHEIHQQQQQAKQQKTAAPSLPGGPSVFDPNEDQAKYFRDAAHGDRHKRLLKVARAIRARGGDVEQIKKALNYHASHFTEPLDDQSWIDRVAVECVSKYAPEIAAV